VSSNPEAIVNAPGMDMSGRNFRLYVSGDGQATHEEISNNGSLEHSVNTMHDLSDGYTNCPDVIHEARSLTAREYLRKGFINDDEVGPDGTISADNDPYMSSSIYYVVANEEHEIVATTRKIVFDKEAGETSFPVWAHKDVFDPEIVEEVEAIGLDRCVEISALAKDKQKDADNMATLKLYRSLYQDAIMENSPSGVKEEVFLMALSPQLYEQFSTFFGSALQRMGPDLEYPGEEVVPALLRTKQGSLDIIRAAKDENNPTANVQEFVVHYMLDGCSSDTLDPVILDELSENGFDEVLEKLGVNSPEKPEITDEGQGLEEDFETTENAVGFLKKVEKRKPELIAAAGLIGYTVLRTLGVKHGISPYSNVDWRTFLAIEVATTPPYVLSMGNIARSVKSPEQFTNLQLRKSEVIAGASLVSPYAYVAANGEGMPPEAWMGVGGVFAFSAISAGIRAYRSRRSTNQLSSEMA
jgi:hypothetical protein